MTRLLDRPPAGPARSPNNPSVPDENPWIDSTPAAEHLRQHCAAVRLQLRWWGTSRTLSARQIVPVAVTARESVDKLRAWATGRCLSASTPGLYGLPEAPGDQSPPGRRSRAVKTAAV